MKTIDILDATGSDVIVGRHALWFPSRKLKVPFQFGGRIVKYGTRETSHDLATLPHELAILRALAERKMAPPIGDLVFVETLISNHPGAWHADPVGVWSYEMEDATKLPPGHFSIDEMQRLPIVGSAGAWGDVRKAGNVVNGYLVDVRRSAGDMLRWDGIVAPLPVEPLEDNLAARVHCECQFPSGERDVAYQDFWIAGFEHRGQRRVATRAEILGFQPREGESVVDIGCLAGGFLQYAAFRGARCVGVEIDKKYVECGRALAKSCNQNISFRQMNIVDEYARFRDWIRTYFSDGVDHLLLLSLEKHIGEGLLFSIVDDLKPRNAYIETNAVKSRQHLKMWEAVSQRGGKHVGFTEDRNLRCVYRIEAAREKKVMSQHG